MKRKLLTWTMILVMTGIILWTASAIYAALTKTTAFDTIDAWQAVAAATSVAGAAEDISGSYSTLLFVEIALTDTDAQSGVTVIVEVSYAADDWITLTTFTGTAETPATTTLNDAAANAGDTSITLTDATTGDFDVPGRKWFIVDGTVGNSESVRTNINATHTVTLFQDLLRSHANSLNVWDRVDDWCVAIPFGASQVRTLILNTDADAGIHFRTYCSKVSAIQ